MKSYYIDNRPMTDEEKNKYFGSPHDFSSLGSKELREDITKKINVEYNERL